MRCDYSILKQLVFEIFIKVGLENEEAKILADSLVFADLRGISSHGVSKVKIYSQRIESGVVQIGAKPIIIQEHDSTLAVDGQNGIGASIGIQVMNLCIERAKKNGCCFATVKNGTHFGTGAYFTEYAADNKMIGVALCNTEAGVVPFGGAKPMLGTNPLSVSVPAGKYSPVILDMATSTIAKGKIRLAKREGKEIPKGLAVDSEGRDTTDPEKVLNGGALLPFGGPKGYAIGLLIDIICSCLGGALDSRRTPPLREDLSHPQNIGYFIGAFDISKFLPYDVFIKRIDFMLDEFKNCPTSPGFKEVMLPGEIEHNNYLKNLKEGIEISNIIMGDLISIADKYNVKHPF